MRLIECIVDAPPRALELALALADRPGAALFGAGGRAVYVASDPVASARSLDPEPSLALDPDAGPAAGVPRWLGLLPYEARRGLERPVRGAEPDPRPPPHLSEPLWLRYGAVAEIADGVRVLGDDEACVVDLVARLGRRPARTPPPRLALAEPLEAAERHVERIHAALEHIRRGDVYQVNLARRFRFEVEGHPLALLAELSRTELARFPMALSASEIDVVGASPESFVRFDAQRRLFTEPIKGTRPRVGDPARDAELCRELDENPKECAELTMILDVERNDLGRIAETGSVRVSQAPHVETFGTVHHRLATIAANIRPALGRAELLEALLPSGSVTGAPKVRAMELIARLEAHRRGLYTGAFGALCHDGSLTLAMAIRTLSVVGGEGHYFSGGGIVADSDPALEVEETLWKAQRILALAGAGNWA